MYSIVRHFHLLAAGAASPGGLAHPVAEGHHVIHRSGNPRPTAQHHDLAVRQYKSARAIRDMPPHLSQKLFKLLRMTRPEILSTRVWTTMFFSQPWMDTIGHPAKNLDELKERQNVVHPLYVLDLEGLDPSQVLDTTLQSQYFLRTHGVIGPQLETINLNNMTQLSDKCLAKLVGKCSNLRRLFLKACENVGDLTLAALPENSLEVLNISFVKGPTAKGLQEMVYRCRELRVLKLVGVTNVRDNWLVKLKDSWEAERQDQQLSSQTEQEDQQQETAETWPLQYLQNLKISHTGIGDRGLKAILEFCGRTLQRLDISSTNVTRVGLIADYCTWEDEDEEEEAQTTQQNDTKNSDSSSSKGRSKKNRQQRRLRNRQTQLEKLNLTRVKVQSINDLIKLFDAIPPGSLHTLLLGYLSISAIPLRASDLARLAPIFWTWTKEPHSGVATIAGSSDASSANATTWLGIRHDLDPNPFRHIHSLSFFGCTQHVTRQYLGRDDGLFMVLQIFAPHLRRLELGWTNVQAYQLEAILFTKAVPGPTEDDSDNDDIVNDGMAVEPMIAQPNWVLEELGLDGCTLTKEMVDVLTSCRRLERLSLINSRLDSQEQVERLIRACPQLKSLDLTGCRGIDLALRRTMLQHVREQTLPSPTL
ncbi:hypothetical protein BGZ73_008588 [Actinomortierella ambigua]|nr:hypothetical protein BGZ73_008588 [Actinomortierella ambigua]